MHREFAAPNPTLPSERRVALRGTIQNRSSGLSTKQHVCFSLITTTTQPAAIRSDWSGLGFPRHQPS